MNTRDILNATLYPRSGQNARRKDFPYYDALTITAGVLEYFFFVTALGNIFQRNKRLPLSGSEVFFIESISAYLDTTINTTAQINALNELLQQSYLAISVDNRLQCKIPGMDFLQYKYTLNENATPEQLQINVHNVKRNLPLPIIMNSTSAFEFKFVTTAAAATAFDTVPFKLVLHGLQVDKLESFYYDNLKNNKFQQVPVTYYDTIVIPNGNQQTFSMFAEPNKAKNLFSQTFPLSDLQTFSLQNIEVLFNQPDVPIVPGTIYDSRLQNNLRISIDDVDYYNANLQDMLSVVAGFAGNITSAGADTTAYSMLMNVRQSKTLRVPLEFPANAKVNINLTQPAASLGITGEFTVAMRGVETRRVA
ncbi:MAG: hypothetical protein IPM51_12185 [Sphingobacteriaceae bacterium]|nr:hypothetical protein [Sphingobacteriaceae bacterium]